MQHLDHWKVLQPSHSEAAYGDEIEINGRCISDHRKESTAGYIPCSFCRMDTWAQTWHAFQLVAIKQNRLKWDKQEIDGVRNFQKFIAIEVSSTLQSSPHRSIKKLLNDVGQLFTNNKNKFRYGNQQSRILANYKMPSEIGDMGNQDTKLTSVHSHICDYYLLNKT